MKTVVTKGDFCGSPTLHIHYEGRPSWKSYGTGWKNIEFRVDHDGSLAIIASETPEGTRGEKEVMVGVPADAMPRLLAFVAPETTALLVEAAKLLRNAFSIIDSEYPKHDDRYAEGLAMEKLAGRIEKVGAK